MPIQRYSESSPIYADINVAEENHTDAVPSNPIYPTPHRYDAGLASSSAAIDHDVRIGVQVGDFLYFIGTVSVPAGAGLTNVPTVDVLATLLATPNDGLVLAGGSYLVGQLAATLDSGESLVIALIGGSV